MVKTRVQCVWISCEGACEFDNSAIEMLGCDGRCPAMLEVSKVQGRNTPPFERYSSIQLMCGNNVESKSCHLLLNWPGSKEPKYIILHFSRDI